MSDFGSCYSDGLIIFALIRKMKSKMECVKVDVRVDRIHPTVKLEVHFEDKPPRFHTVLQKSLIIASDGINVFLRRDTVE